MDLVGHGAAVFPLAVQAVAELAGRVADGGEVQAQVVGGQAGGGEAADARAVYDLAAVGQVEDA